MRPACFGASPAGSHQNSSCTRPCPRWDTAGDAAGRATPSATAGDDAAAVGATDQGDARNVGARDRLATQPPRGLDGDAWWRCRAARAPGATQSSSVCRCTTNDKRNRNVSGDVSTTNACTGFGAGLAALSGDEPGTPLAPAPSPSARPPLATDAATAGPAELPGGDPAALTALRGGYSGGYRLGGGKYGAARRAR